MSVETQPQTPPSPGWLPLSHHQSGSQCVRCFIQHSCMYFYHLAASSVRKEGWMCAVGLQNGVTDFASCFQTCRTTAGSHQTTRTPVSRHVPRSASAQMKAPESFWLGVNCTKIKDVVLFKWRNRMVFSWWVFLYTKVTAWFVILGTCGPPEASKPYFGHIVRCVVVKTRRDAVWKQGLNSSRQLHDWWEDIAKTDSNVFMVVWWCKVSAFTDHDFIILNFNCPLLNKYIVIIWAQLVFRC